MDKIQLLAELEMANKAVSKWQATAELHRLELSTLKAILEKKNEALELILSNWPTKEDGMGEFLPVGVKMCRIALSLTPETYAKEEDASTMADKQKEE